MNCVICKRNTIGPKTKPFGGFLCGNGHMQCHVCNNQHDGRCGLCNYNTTFVQMSLNPKPESLESDEIKNSSNIMIEKQSSRVIPQTLFNEIETQSNISQEHLSMPESTESVALDDPHDNLEEKGTMIRVINKKSLTKHLETMVPEQMHKLTKIQKENAECFRKENAKLLCGLSQSKERTSMANDGNPVCLSDFKPVRNDNSNEFKAGRGFNEKVFPTQVDLNEQHVIHTSELRFMESSDSLNKLLTLKSNRQAAGTNTNQEQSYTNQEQSYYPPPYAYVVRTGSGTQLEPLTTNIMRDFDCHNTVHSSEAVENYLKTYGPLRCYHFPNHNCQHSQCDYSWKWNQEQHKQQMKSKSVSTDSDPKLKAPITDKISADIEAKAKTRDYFVMHATGVCRLQTDNVELADKFGRPSLDMRMQKILETFQEDPNTRKIVEKPGPTKGNYMKLLTPEAETVEALTPKHLHHQQQQQNVKSKTASDPVILRLLNSYHALYQPTDIQAHPQQVAKEPPLPQHHVIPCTPAAIKELTSAKAQCLSTKPLTICMLNIPRRPIQCPESSCQRMIFVSDFNKHLVVDHNHLPLERMTPFQCKNFFVDPRLAHCGSSKCHALYLLRDKITDLGSGQYKDFLPVLVMSSRVSLHQLCGVRGNRTSPVEFLLIWITGIVPEKFPISVSLTAWPRSGKVPSCHVVYSGEMHSVRESQKGFDVWQTGRMLMLSGHEVDLLTNGGKDMLNMQLVVH